MPEKFGDENLEPQQESEKVLQKIEPILEQKQEEKIELPNNKELLSIEEGVQYLSQKLDELLKEKSHRPINIVVYGCNHAGKSYFMNQFCTTNKQRFKIVSDSPSGPLDNEIPYQPLTEAEKDILKEETSPDALKIKGEMKKRWTERKALADCYILHDDGIAMAEWMKPYQYQYPGDSNSIVKNREGEDLFKTDFSVYIYNPNLRHLVDDKMRNLVDLVIRNEESEDRNKKYKRTGKE